MKKQKEVLVQNLREEEEVNKQKPAETCGAEETAKEDGN